MNWNEHGKITISQYGVDDADIGRVREHYAQTLTSVSVDALDANGRVTVSDLHFSCGEFDIWGGQCPTGMKVALQEPPSSWCLYVPVAGAMEISTGRLSSVHSGGLLLTDLSSTSELKLLPGRSHIGVSFPKRAIDRELSMLIEAPVNREVSLTPVSLWPDHFSQAMARHVAHIWSSLVRSAQDEICLLSIHSLFRALLVALLECVDHNYSSTIQRSNQTAIPRQVRRAIEFMNDNIDAPLDIDTIAKETNVSARALQLAFQQFQQTTPMNFLRRLRLHAVRSDLIGPDTGETVAMIAIKRGFTHMGRFAAQYRQAFGELPTETLRRKGRDNTVEEYNKDNVPRRVGRSPGNHDSMSFVLHPDRNQRSGSNGPESRATACAWREPRAKMYSNLETNLPQRGRNAEKA